MSSNELPAGLGVARKQAKESTETAANEGAQREMTEEEKVSLINEAANWDELYDVLLRIRGIKADGGVGLFTERLLMQMVEKGVMGAPGTETKGAKYSLADFPRILRPKLKELLNLKNGR